MLDCMMTGLWGSSWPQGSVSNTRALAGWGRVKNQLFCYYITSVANRGAATSNTSLRMQFELWQRQAAAAASLLRGVEQEVVMMAVRER